MMCIGILEVRLDLPGVHSLKEKRGIIKSLLAQVHHRFHVAVAEVAYLDQWQTAGLGFVAVGNQAPIQQRLMQNVMEFIAASGEVVLLDYRVEVIT